MRPSGSSLPLLQNGRRYRPCRCRLRFVLLSALSALTRSPEAAGQRSYCNSTRRMVQQRGVCLQPATQPAPVPRLPSRLTVSLRWRTGQLTACPRQRPRRHSLAGRGWHGQKCFYDKKGSDGCQRSHLDCSTESDRLEQNNTNPWPAGGKEPGMQRIINDMYGYLKGYKGYKGNKGIVITKDIHGYL